MNVDLASILLLLGMGQCLFLIGTILVKGRPIHTANYLLVALLFSFLWFQVEFFLIRHTLDPKLPFLYSTRYGSWLIVGPLMLLYNRALLMKGFKVQVPHVIHFLPFLLFTVLLPLGLGGLITHRAVDYGMLTVFDEWNQEPITTLQYLYGVVFALQFIHAGVYLYLTRSESSQLLRQARTQLSDLDRIKSLRYLYQAALVIIASSAIFMLYIFLNHTWRRHYDYLYVLPMLVFVFGIAYQAIARPNLLLQIESNPTRQKYAKSSLTPGAKDSLESALRKKLDADKIYRNGDLRLSDLAGVLDVSTHHLSQIINERMQQNFHDLINMYRIQDAKKWIIENPEMTLLEIAMSVGFNNKNSFNNAFKKMEGLTPSDFRKKNLS